MILRSPRYQFSPGTECGGLGRDPQKGHRSLEAYPILSLPLHVRATEINVEILICSELKKKPLVK